jgi:hypothetical protein
MAPKRADTGSVSQMQCGGGGSGEGVVHHRESLKSHITALPSWTCRQIWRCNIRQMAHEPYYEGRLQSLWSHIITTSRNFVEVRWRSLFRSTSLGKRCTSYNAPPTSRKRAADPWSLRNFLPRSSLFLVGRAQKSHGTRSGLYGGCSNGVPLIHFSHTEQRIQFRSRPMRFLGFSNHEKGAPRKKKKFELINGLQHILEKWVERCKKCITCQGRYFE